MKQEIIRKTFEVEADKKTMEEFERFLALLHYSNRFGHSAYFGMPLDGDGWDKFTVSPVRKEFKDEVDLIGGVGGGLEYALMDGYAVKRLDNYTSYYRTKSPNILLSDDVVIKTINQEK